MMEKRYTVYNVSPINESAPSLFHFTSGIFNFFPRRPCRPGRDDVQAAAITSPCRRRFSVVLAALVIGDYYAANRGRSSLFVTGRSHESQFASPRKRGKNPGAKNFVEREPFAVSTTESRPELSYSFAREYREMRNGGTLEQQLPCFDSLRPSGLPISKNHFPRRVTRPRSPPNDDYPRPAYHRLNLRKLQGHRGENIQISNFNRGLNHVSRPTS